MAGECDAIAGKTSEIEVVSGGAFKQVMTALAAQYAV